MNDKLWNELVHVIDALATMSVRRTDKASVAFEGVFRDFSRLVYEEQQKDDYAEPGKN